MVGKRILITGYKGYIGQHLMAALRNSEYEGLRIAGIDLIDGDNLLTAELPEADIVIHLAAQAGAIPSMKNPMWDAETNILGTIRIAQHYGRYDTKIIYTTSGGALAPESPYGLSKQTGERYIRMLVKNYVICRLSSVYGEKPRGVVDTFINTEKPVIYGDGSAIRDFVHVEDIAQALVQAMGWQKGDYQLGSGVPTTIREIAEATGKEVEYKEARQGELHTAVLDNTTPDWKPTINVIDYVKRRCV